MSSLKAGYDYFMKNSASFLGGEFVVRTSGKYINDIESKIQQLGWVINSSAMRLNGEISNNEQIHGFIAEYWHAYTYRLSSGILRTYSWVKVEDSPEARHILGGADISRIDGKDVGLKFYDSGSKSALAQATSIRNSDSYKNYMSSHPGSTDADFLKEYGFDENTDINLPLYEGQVRLIPAGQLEDARRALQKRIDDYLAAGGNVDDTEIYTLQETKNALADHIEGPNGESSMPITYEQAKQLQKCAKEGNFDPKDFDIDAARLADSAFLLENSIKAGLNAAWVTLLLKTTPGIVKCLKQALDDGYIEREDLLQLGKDSVDSASVGFVRGSITAAITTAAEMGWLGDTIKQAASETGFSSGIAVIVSTAMSIVADSIDLAKHRITVEEYTYRIDRTVFIASASYICGVTGQSLLIEFPVAGYLLGSFVGAIIGGVFFDVKEKCFVSVCANKGWTFFGLVKQDYSLPDDVLRQLGYNLIDYDTVEYDLVQDDEVENDDVDYDCVNYDSVEMTYLRRGVIGVRKIGYVIL